MPRHAATICFSTSLGHLEVEAAPAGVTRVRLSAKGRPREVGNEPALSLARQAREEILSYVAGDLRKFTVPVVLEGTDFQRAVWARLREIPFGKSETYGALAQKLGKPRAARAVGTACGANPLPILVPCHRIVGGNGSAVGNGHTVPMKKALLELERRHAVAAKG